MKPYDVAAIRARFPSLANTLPDGRPIAFLDGPAGTQVPQSVIDAYADSFVPTRTTAASSAPHAHKARWKRRRIALRKIF